MLGFHFAAQDDYLEVHCDECVEIMTVEYMGWDPSIPRFRFRCRNCGVDEKWKVDPVLWKGLPPRPL